MWLLLHFEDIRAPLHRNEVLRRLRSHIPGYEKGAGDAFAFTKARLDMATQRADALAEQYNPRTEPEPFTAIVELVKLLVNLRR